MKGMRRGRSEMIKMAAMVLRVDLLSRPQGLGAAHRDCFKGDGGQAPSTLASGTPVSQP